MVLRPPGVPECAKKALQNGYTPAILRAMSVDADATQALGNRLEEGENVEAAVLGDTRPWYSPVINAVFPRTSPNVGERDYFVVLTNRAVKLVLYQEGMSQRDNYVYLDVPRSEVKVEMYRDNLLGFWRLTIVEHGTRWDIRGAARRGVARSIAEALGWSGSA